MAERKRKEKHSTMNALRASVVSGAFSRRLSYLTPHGARRPEGALCSDYTFARILGAEKGSGLILKDLIGAWCAMRGLPEELDAAKIVARKAPNGLPPRSRGALTAEVRAKGASRGYLVDVQHRTEPFFPQSSIFDTACELVTEDAADRSTMELRPTHALAFCDFTFAADGPFGAGDSEAAEFVVDPTQALQSFSLHANDVLGQRSNETLARDMQARMSFTFALLPHAPRLEQLTAETPPLLRWASLVAHANPLNANTVPKAARTEGIDTLLELLKSTSSLVAEERRKAEADHDQNLRAVKRAMA